MCCRLQTHFNTCANIVAENQKDINSKIKEIDRITAEQLNKLKEKQRTSATQSETFAKVRNISQTLARCNQLLNENIESLEILNNLLPIDQRLEPFVWETSS